MLGLLGSEWWCRLGVFVVNKEGGRGYYRFIVWYDILLNLFCRLWFF